MFVDETLKVQIGVVGRQEEDARDEKFIVAIVILSGSAVECERGFLYPWRGRGRDALAFKRSAALGA